MKKEVFYFEKRGGKIVSSFPSLKDGIYKIEAAKKTRSYSQNRLYWGYILTFILMKYKEVGHLIIKDTLHEIIKDKLVPRERVYSDFTKRKYILKRGSTANLSQKQFTQLIEMIKALFEFGEMEKLGLPKIESFVIPDINDDDLLYWESIIC